MTSREYKKVILAALLIVLAFIMGVLIGYFSREVWHRFDSRTKLLDKLNREADESISQRLFDHIDTKQLDQTLRKLTEHPRLAGSKFNRDAGYYVHQEFLKYGLASEISEYNVTLSYPEDAKDNYISVVGDDGSEIFRTDVTVVGDEVPPYNAFSPSGRVQGDLIFLNYARPSDFQWLKGQGINCTGKIVIAKYGRIFRGNKVRNAELAGALGIILYSDPADYAPYSNISGTYPDSFYLPEDGAQRGNIVLIKGDQSTPGYPANEFAYRLTDDELKQKLPSIPCLPISYKNAYHLLRLMKGDNVPDSWRGGLNITYKLGPGFTNGRVVLNVNNRLEYTKIYNVIGRVEGDIEPDRYVIVGNHRDAWVYGSVDPTSGSIVLMEMARIFGQLLKEGWRPRRTVLFCSWDAEEFGLVGSYEWVEEHIKWLYPNAVAYINTDTAVAGNDTIYLKTVPLLQKVFEEAADKVPDPNNRYGSVFEACSNHKSYRARQIGGGSDQVPFIAGAGIPSIYPKYVYVENKWKVAASPLYHSRYEDYHGYILVDPEMKFAQAMTSILSEMTRNLADSRIIPFDVLHYAEFVRSSIKGLKLEGDFPSTSVEYLQKSANTFYESCIKFKTAVETVDRDNSLLIRQLNDRLMSLEKAFLIDEGLPGNAAFKHILHSPTGTVDYYTGTSFPGLGGLQQCIESKSRSTCFPEFEKHLTVIIHRIYAAAKVLDGGTS